jgi:hypothetical protein
MEKYIKKFPSGSNLNTVLLKKKNFFFVRKGIFKKKNILNNKNLICGQYTWLKKMKNESISTPEVYGLTIKNNKYFYDLEYINQSNFFLKNFKDKIKLKNFFLILKKFYEKNSKFSNKSTDLFKKTCNLKALPSILSLKKKSLGSQILKKKFIYINNIKYLNLNKYLMQLIKKKNKLSNIILNNFDSKKKTYIHGDLTYENILYKKNKFYLIDPYGGCVDVRSNKNFLYKTNLMFDLGKICQSSVANYEKWKNISSIKEFYINKKFIIKKNFLPSLKKDFYLLKNIFGKKNKNFENICLVHMVIHLCRLIRYRIKHNYASALYAYVIATYCSHVLINNKRC